MENIQQKTLLSTKKTCEMAGISRSYIYALMDRGEFPLPIKIGRANRWVDTEVQAWIDQRIKETRAAC